MSPEHASLWDRIQAFSIDGDSSPSRSFASRLARENGWSAAFAERVVVEYKRFVFLAMTAGHPVTPSDQVDQAWHLHLTYTRSYWDRFCGEVLGRPLHHEPTRGGSAEAKKFHQQYDQTLALYRATFGADPPSDIWPPAEVRFGEDLHFVRVNTVRDRINWRTLFRRWGAIMVLFASAVAPLAVWILSGNEGPIRPEPWMNALIGGSIMAAALLALSLQVWLGRHVRALYIRSAGPVAEVPPLDRYDVAYLLAGEIRVAQAAIIRHAETGVLTYDTTTYRLKRTGELAGDATVAERAAFESVKPDDPNGTHPLWALERTTRAIRGKFVHLDHCGLAPPHPQRSRATWVPRLGLGVFLFFATLCFMNGCLMMSKAMKPGGEQLCLLAWLPWLVGGGVLVWWVGRKPVLTKAGEAAVREYEERMCTANGSDDPGSRVAVFGAPGVEGTAMMALASVLVVSQSKITVDEVTFSAGDSGDDDGDSGCSGCGGCGCGD
jgi:uncharacterized protein (TIGR04222 family)